MLAQNAQRRFRSCFTGWVVLRKAARFGAAMTQRAFLRRWAQPPPARLLLFCWHPLAVPIGTPTKGRGGRSRVTELSPAAARWAEAVRAGRKEKQVKRALNHIPR